MATKNHKTEEEILENELDVRLKESEDDSEEMEDEEDEEKEEKGEDKKEEKKKPASVSEQIKILTDDDNSLSEDFKEKTQVLFESIISQKTKAIEEEYKSLYESKVTELEESAKAQLEETIEEVSSQIDSYLSYAIEEWVEENKLAIEGGLRTEIAENFIASMKNVFEEHYIDIPEEKTDLVDELSEKLDEMKNTVNEITEKNVKLNEQNKDLLKKDLINTFIEEETDSFSMVQKEKLKSLLEDIDTSSASIDSQRFVKRMNIIKESYFTKSGESKETETLMNESASSDENLDTLGENVDTSIDEKPRMPNKMDLYVSALSSRFNQSPPKNGWGD